jgi:hypothetical protein
MPLPENLRWLHTYSGATQALPKFGRQLRPYIDEKIGRSCVFKAVLQKHPNMPNGWHTEGPVSVATAGHDHRMTQLRCMFFICLMRVCKSGVPRSFRVFVQTVSILEPLVAFGESY